VEGEAGDPAEIYDAVLVGGGVGSLAAAIRLSERGLRPLIVEKTGTVGGAAAYSGGIVWAPDNHHMRAQGLRDSISEAVTYLESVSMGRWDPRVARAYVRAIPWIVAWLEQTTGLRWLSYRGLPDYHAERPGGKVAGRCLLPHPRHSAEVLREAGERQPELSRVRESVHFPDEISPWSAGRALVGFLWSRVLDLETPYRVDCRAVRLIRDDQAVAGVQLDGPAGRSRVRARHGVLLNTGGFEWNARLTTAAVPGFPAHPQTPPTADGDGHIMGGELGAAFALMDQTTLIPAIRVPDEDNDGRPLYRLFFQELTRAHSLVVNRAGRRFANETFFSDLARGWSQYDDGRAEWPNVPMYFVFDEQYRRAHGLPGSLDVGVCLTSHADLASLARARQIDAEGLRDQVLRLNDDAVTGADREFHRGATAYQRAFAGGPRDTANPTIGTVSVPPFYSLELHPSTSGHRGGLVTDQTGRVLDVTDAAIPGLYACGSTAAGLVTGGSYLSGASLGAAIAFGVLSADAMLGAAGVGSE
jgi:succinate dehydrogenase/fumarate reductase flavoprotein subunit